MSDPIYIGPNGDNGDLGSAYVYFQLYEGDKGSVHARTARPEFNNRTPKCRAEFDETGITLAITNSGVVASDLVMVEYQVVYCTASFHTAQDGFTQSHAGEKSSDATDSYETIDFVPAQNSIVKRIRFKKWNGHFGTSLANLYFRAKVSTIWSPQIPMSQWNFASDPTVTEAHLPLAP